MGRLSWIIRVTLHAIPYKREVEGHLTTYRRGKFDVTVEAEIGMMWLQAKKCQQLPKTG